MHVVVGLKEQREAAAMVTRIRSLVDGAAVPAS